MAARSIDKSTKLARLNTFRVKLNEYATTLINKTASRSQKKVLREYYKNKGEIVDMYIDNVQKNRKDELTWR